MKNHTVLTPAADIEQNTVLLEAFFNSVQQYQLLLNTDLEVIAFNDCAYAFHRAYENMRLEKHKNIVDYIHASLATDFRDQCRKALGGESVEYEHFINGMWFDFVITALQDSHKRIIGLSIVGNNINSQKHTQNIIRRQSQSLSNIAWFQSHQVRRPVSSILAVMNLIKEEKDKEQLQEYLQLLETATNQLDDVIRAIVRESRSV